MEKPTEELIFDRNNTDVINAKNNPNNQHSNRGNYNISDLLRIEKWTIFLSELLKSYGYYVETNTRTDYNLDYIPTQEELDRIKNNVINIKKAYYSLQTTPTITTGKKTINYVDANNIEKVLFDIDYLIKSMEQNFIKSGVARSGQNRIWQQRFRTKRTWEAIPFETFNQVLDIFTLANISTQSDTIDDINSVYGTILKTNNKYNELDNLIGGINE